MAYVFYCPDCQRPFKTQGAYNIRGAFIHECPDCGRSCKGLPIEKKGSVDDRESPIKVKKYLSGNYE